MKLVASTNDTITIQADVNKPGDYEIALQVAAKMAKSDFVNCDIAAVDDAEQWVMVCAVWDNYQAIELKDLFKEAKKIIIS